MPTQGKATCRTIEDGWWYACDIEDIAGTGKEAMTWRGHMVVGYDTGTKSYRAFRADNSGVIAAMNGSLTGDQFVLETPEPISIRLLPC